MHKKLEALQKEITTTEESRKQFIAKFENQLQAVNSEIEACEASIQQAVSNDDFEQFEAETDRLALLKKKKAHFEEGLNNAETAVIGDAEKMENAIRKAVAEYAMSYRKELVQHTEAMLKIGKEVEAARNDANQLLGLIRNWSDRPVGMMGMDDSSNVNGWAVCASQHNYYSRAIAEHPEWSKMK